MKRIKSAAAFAAIAAAVLLSPFRSEDAHKRIVVQTLCIWKDSGTYLVQADDGLYGRGADPAAAFADLERTAPGLPTLSTARQLVVSETAADRLEALIFLDCLHPGTEVYRSAEPLDAGDVTDFLNRHATGVSIKNLRAAALTGEPLCLPRVTGSEGRYRICDGQ